MRAFVFDSLSCVRGRFAALPLGFFLLLASGGCRETTAPERLALEVRAEGDSLVLRNPTSVRLAYFAVEQGTAGRINWAPCNVATSACLRIPPRSGVRIGLTDVMGFEAGRSVVVYSWTVRDGVPHELRRSHIDGTVVTP